MGNKKGLILITLSVALIGGGGYFAYANGKLDKITDFLGFTSSSQNIFDRVFDKKTTATKEETIVNIVNEVEKVVKMEKGTLDLGLSLDGASKEEKVNLKGNVRMVIGEKQSEISLTKTNESRDLLFGIKIDSETGNGVVDFRGVKDLDTLIQKIDSKKIEPLKEIGTKLETEITDKMINDALDGLKETSKGLIDGLTTEDGNFLHFYKVEGIGDIANLTKEKNEALTEEEKKEMIELLNVMLSPYPETQIRNNVLMLDFKQLHLGIDALYQNEKYKDFAISLLDEYGVTEEEFEKDKEKSLQKGLDMEKLETAILKIAVDNQEEGLSKIAVQIIASEGENNANATIYLNATEQELFLIDEKEFGENELTDEKIVEISENLEKIIAKYSEKIMGTPPSSEIDTNQTLEETIEIEEGQTLEIKLNEELIGETEEVKVNINQKEDEGKTATNGYRDEVYYVFDDEYLEEAPTFLKASNIQEIYNGLVSQNAWNIDSDFVGADGIRYINYSLDNAPVNDLERYETILSGEIQVYVDKEGNPQPTSIKYYIEVKNKVFDTEENYAMEIRTIWENGVMKEEIIENEYIK